MTKQTDQPMPEVSPAQAEELLLSDALLLDVREPDEWEAGHVPDAHHLPLGQLGERYTELPPDRSIVAVCRSGGRSGQATAALRGAGYDVVNLGGGMQAWQQAGLPVVTDDGQAGTVA